VAVGILVPWHIRTLQQHSPMGVAEMLGVDSRSAYVRRQDESDRFYSSSWLLVHYLMFGDNGARAQRLNDFVSLWEQGRPQEAAFREAFGEAALVEKGLKSYLFQKALAYGKVAVDLSLQKERFPARTLTPAEAAVVRAGLHVAMGRPREARALIEEAKATTPVPAAAYDAEALLLDRADDAGALTAYRKAAEAGSTSFYTHYRLAQVLARNAGQDKEAHARVARTLERAKELNPDYAYTYSFLADEKAYLGQTEDALASARMAVELEPGGAYHHLAMARVLSSLSRDEEAMASASRGRALAGEEWERREAQRTIEYIGRAHASREASSTRVAASRPPIVIETPPDAASGEAETVALLAEACDAGDKRACLNAAVLQLKAKKPGDEAKAIATLSALCDGGQKEACTMLALQYAGKATARDQARARDLLKKACDAGEPAACGALQTMPK